MRRLRAAYPLTGGLAMALVAALAPASTADSAAAPREIVVKGATIWTVSESGTIDRADLLVRDGKVAAVLGADQRVTPRNNRLERGGLVEVLAVRPVLRLC